MKKNSFLIGMGIGVAAGSAAVIGLSSGKKSKNVLSKTLKTVGEVVDAVSESLGK